MTGASLNDFVQGNGWLIAGLAAALVAVTLLRRVRVIGTIVSFAMTLGSLVLLLMLVQQRASFDPMFSRVADFLHLTSDQQVVGDETRVPMAEDGHFWVEVTIGGAKRRMLVDSGATLTALSPGTARAAGLEVTTPVVPMVLQTANGSVRAQTAKVPELRIGNIVARDLTAVVSPSFGEVNVVGMNFLSRLASWRVEGRTLILTPHHPQGQGHGQDRQQEPGGDG